jgi:L-threo-3-deoxy-hexylosonate aldolase
MTRCGGSIGKLVRLKAGLDGLATAEGSRPFPFLLLDGLIGDLTPWTHCGGHGTVSGILNFAPLASVRLWELLNIPSPTKHDLAETVKLQAILSRADVHAVPAGIRGMSE